MDKFDLKKTESLLWTFECVYDYESQIFTIYANGVKSFTTSNTDEAPAAMLEYFENWDTDEVTI